MPSSPHSRFQLSHNPDDWLTISAAECDLREGLTRSLRLACTIVQVSSFIFLHRRPEAGSGCGAGRRRRSAQSKLRATPATQLIHDHGRARRRGTEEQSVGADDQVRSLDGRMELRKYSRLSERNSETDQS